MRELRKQEKDIKKYEICEFGRFYKGKKEEPAEEKEKNVKIEYK